MNQEFQEREKPVLVLFRNDLRVSDNGALAVAAQSGKPVVAAFVLDEESPGMRPVGGAWRWWMHHSLRALSGKMQRLGAPLILRRGAMPAVVYDLVAESEADLVVWNRRYDPGGSSADARLAKGLEIRGIRAEDFDGHLLHEPSQLKTASGSSYKVFSAFWRALASGPEFRDPRDPPEQLTEFGRELSSEHLDSLLPLPSGPDWSGGLRECWEPGEDGAHAQLDRFLSEDLDDYANGRDFPARAATSRLSPHLAHGEISPHTVFAALRDRGHDSHSETFRKEVGWREFCYHLLFQNPQMHEKGLQASFDAFPWASAEPQHLVAWQRGLTGYPIVDAGMRELWQTGTMHNRVRMIAASFLTKHLLIDWRVGEKWFWDTLVDADPASNPGNWQWVAGTGADAAPYFRIFNPTLQGGKFDPDGIYVKRYVPELSDMPSRYVHRPWEAPLFVLTQSGVTLGETYPAPIVSHGFARERALCAYRAMKDTG